MYRPYYDPFDCQIQCEELPGYDLFLAEEEYQKWLEEHPEEAM